MYEYYSLSRERVLTSKISRYMAADAPRGPKGIRGALSTL